MQGGAVKEAVMCDSVLCTHIIRNKVSHLKSDWIMSLITDAVNEPC